MERNYRVKVENLDVNPEFSAEKEEQEGIECEGYLLVAFKESSKEDMSISTAANHVSIEMITDWLKSSDDQLKYLILQAALIAYGNIQARRLYEEQHKKNMMRDIFGMIGQRTPMEDND
jgi:hypothetical protein